MEKRKFTRVMFETNGVVTDSEGNRVKGRISNLSLQGMFMLCNAAPAEDEEVTIKIILGDEAAELSLTLRGVVIRSTDEGVAIMFNLKRIDIDAITHLRHILTYALGDSEKVMEEYYDFLSNEMA